MREIHWQTRALLVVVLLSELAVVAWKVTH